jgi:hypothetical protein
MIAIGLANLVSQFEIDRLTFVSAQVIPVRVGSQPREMFDKRMSGCGTKRKCHRRLATSAIGVKADMNGSRALRPASAA